MTECLDNIDDIEDLVSKDDITPRERYQNKKNVTVRAKIKIDRKIKTSIPAQDNLFNGESCVPGTETIYVKTWGCAHNNSDTEYMVGQLADYGYNITSDKDKADLWLLNSCTVKNPSEDTFRNDIQNGLGNNKRVVVAGCVPQGAPKSEYLKGLSIVGVHQIDRVVEVVEETLKGHSVRLLQPKKINGKKVGPSLSLPKIRKNPLIEIISINSGCLNQCTYCKTKHARGDLMSYPPNEIVERAQQAFNEGVCEIWLTSEDTGTYGRDINSSLPELLWKLIDVIPEGCMLRVGMTNPPYILEHLDEISKILNNDKVYSFLHVPVQSGSDAVLADMKREYNCKEFEHVVDFLRKRVNGISIATDIICGFPTETEENFKESLELCEKYKFPSLFINQFFPRPGTPAAKMTRIPANLVKERTKKLTNLFHSYEPYANRVGMEYTALVTEISHDKAHYVGHNKYYEQILLPMKNNLMGKKVKVKIISATKFSMVGELLDADNKWVDCSRKIEDFTNLNSGQFNETNGNPTNEKESVFNQSIMIYGLAFLFLVVLCRLILKFYSFYN